MTVWQHATQGRFIVCRTRKHLCVLASLLLLPALCLAEDRSAGTKTLLQNEELFRSGARAETPVSAPLPATQAPGHSLSPARKLHRTLSAAGASGVLLDWRTGKALAVEGKDLPSGAGSLLKPFFLAFALQHGLVSPGTHVYCRRTLQVAGRTFSCTHPADQPVLDAETALALSCNTWFATLAKRMQPDDVRSALRLAGLPLSETRLQDADTRVLTVLGLNGVQATPAQMAAAYRILLLRESPGSTVWKGLRGSVTYGMANNARLSGMEVMGKTGTAGNPGEWWTHGWFAGGIPGRFLLVVYVPHGDGGAAAALAGQVLQQLVPENVP